MTQHLAEAILPNDAGTMTFSVLATKFGYSVALDDGFTVFLEFYSDIAVHVPHRHP